MMRITFDSAALAQQLSAASRVLNSRNTLPILDYFLLEVQNEGMRLSITASDTDNTVCLSCPLVAYSQDEDAALTRFCISSKLIMNVLREIPSQPVTLTIDMGTMEIRGDYMGGTFAIVGEHANEYPTPPALGEDSETLTLPAHSLLAEIEGTQFAAADDDHLLRVMTGVFFDLTPEYMTCVGTDGRTLVRRCTVSQDVILPHRSVSFIMPKKTSIILRSLLAKTDGMVSIAFTDTQMLVHTDEFDLNARLVDGRYPNYNSVIPSKNPYVVHVNTADFVPALRRALTFANRDSALVRIAPTANALKLKASNVDFATSSEEIIPATFDGPDNFVIGANGNVILNVLSHLPKEITIRLSEPNRAMIFSPVEQDPATAVLMLVMPMRLNE